MFGLVFFCSMISCGCFMFGFVVVALIGLCLLLFDWGIDAMVVVDGLFVCFWFCACFLLCIGMLFGVFSFYGVV